MTPYAIYDLLFTPWLIAACFILYWCLEFSAREIYRSMQRSRWFACLVGGYLTFFVAATLALIWALFQ